jgi:soluble cytochrome b562
MKTLAIIFLALVGTLVINGPIQSYADPQLDALLRIATQARENLKMNISQINNVPDEITRLFKQGSDETDALSNAIDKKDVVSARQHFLSAMNFFKTTNDKINSLNTTQVNNQQQTDALQLQSEITRLANIGETLKTIAITNHASFDFTQFDQLIQKAKQDLDNGNISEASKSIEEANRIVIDAHQSLTNVAKQRTPDRAKDFTEKQIERLDKMGSIPTQNSMMQAPKVSTTSKTSSNFTSYENPKDTVTKLKKLAAAGKVDEALKVIKSFEAHQK